MLVEWYAQETPIVLACSSTATPTQKPDSTLPYGSLLTCYFIWPTTIGNRVCATRTTAFFILITQSSAFVPFLAVVGGGGGSCTLCLALGGSCRPSPDQQASLVRRSVLCAVTGTALIWTPLVSYVQIWISTVDRIRDVISGERTGTHIIFANRVSHQTSLQTPFNNRSR